MSSKVFINSSFVTPLWKSVLPNVLKRVLLFPTMYLIIACYIPVSVLWFISLGHLFLFHFLNKALDKVTSHFFGKEPDEPN